MRLEPVYLVAPKPKPPSMTRRRAVAGMGLCFLFGAGVGSACGYSIGAAAAGPKEGDEFEPLPLTGNAELDELRRLAVAAPIEELVEKFDLFLSRREGYYRDDPVLWRGVERLSLEVLANDSIANRRMRARLLAAAIEAGSPPSALNLDQLTDQLRGVR